MDSLRTWEPWRSKALGPGVRGRPGWWPGPPRFQPAQTLLEEPVNLLEFSLIFQSIQEGFSEGSQAYWVKQVLLFGLKRKQCQE